MHESSCFVTLTYNETNLPWDHSLDVEHWQLFAKRLRKKVGKFRFLHCGEYGDELRRPHYHALLFGVDFSDDRQPIPGTKPPSWHSPTLEKLWGYGFTQLSDVTFGSASYVAGYCIKKVNGDKAEQHYSRTCDHSGQVWNVKPDYATMSRNKGLGTSWFNKYHSEVYPSDQVIINGTPLPPPKFYDKLLKEKNENLWKRVQKRRIKNANTETIKANQTQDRLDIREIFTHARLGHQSQRKL